MTIGFRAISKLVAPIVGNVICLSRAQISAVKMSTNPDYKSATSIHEFTVKNIKGEDVKLDVYKGHVCIIVNVASQCGLTANNYKQLNEMFEKYAEEKGLRILAFPCNQFAGQEPGNPEEIVCFAKDRKVKFDLFEKIDVNGDSASPLWKFLKMEIVPEGKNFRLVSEDELPAVADILVQYMPESLKFHQTIQTYLNNKVWDFHFYVAKNWPEDPICLHFPGCTSTPNQTTYESVTAFCPSERAELVDLLTSEDILLDLTQPLYLNFTHEAIVNRFERHYEAHDKITGDVYVCDNPPQDDSTDGLPPDVELVRLQPEHMKAVHDLYPASDIECREVFEKLVAELPAYGIFVEGKLAAWMVQSYYGAMFSMQTRPEFRRKGYGIYLARRLTKEVAARGYKPFVVIRPENEASRSLYTKLGFEKRFRTVRAVLRPR